MQTFNLDLTIKSVQPRLLVKQGDVGRKIRAVITDAGAGYPIPYDAALSVWYSSASGAGNYSRIGDASAFSVDGNTVTVELITQMLTDAGSGELCLVINNADGSQLGTWNIPYIVERVPGAGSEGATQYYTAFSESVEEAKEAAAEAIRIAESYGNVGNVFGTKIGNGSVSFSARVGSGITFIGRMKAVQSGEGDPTPDNIRPITVTETVNVSVTDAGGVTQQSHSIALPTPCPKGYIDWGRRKYVQTYKQIVLTGTENWASTWAGRCCGLNIEDCVTGNEADKMDAVYCTHYTTTLSANIYNQTVDNAICTISNYGTIRIRDTSRLDVAVFKAYLAEQYAAGTPVTVIYKLANPVEYDLGVLPSLKALEGTTVFSCDTNDGFTVQYNHDELAVANWESLRDRTDFIVAEGESGIWHYRKWNSGLAECWGKAEKTVAITAQMGNVYINGTASDTTVMYPFKFIEIPNCTFSVVANYAAWCGGGTAITSNELESLELLKSQTPKVYIYKTSASESVIATINFYAAGRWR